MVHDERKRYFITDVVVATISIVTTILLSVFIETEVLAQTISGSISRIGDATHIELQGRKEWQYENIKKNNSQITVTLPPLDEATVVRFSGWSCPFIKEIKINKNAPDGRFELEFYLTSPDVENFDYLTDDPSNLVFDFYKKLSDDATVNKTIATNNENRREELEKKTTLDKKNRKNSKNKKIVKLPEKSVGVDDNYKLKERKPAGDESLQVAQQGFNQPSTDNNKEAATEILYQRGIFDASDPSYERFYIKDYEISDTAIIGSEKNIYIKFPMLYQKQNEFAELMRNAPAYDINPDDTDENKEARLIVTLFNKNRMGSLHETLNYFYKKRPNSKYNEIIKNIEAEWHIRLYERDNDPKDYEAYMSLYEYLIKTYPDSILTERNELLLAYSSLKHDDGARALQYLQKYVSKYPTSEHYDRVRIAMAEAYVLLNKPSDALQMYDEIIKKPLDRAFAIEASYRIGDINFKQADYSLAIENYKKAQNKYPAHKNVYANAAYNISEAQFWLRNYKESLEGYIQFLKMFPTHRYGGFALTRIGELLEIMGANEQKIISAFIEGYYRYPESQGSEVSRIRMLSRDFENIKSREKKYVIAEMDEITKKSTLPGMQEFATLMKSDGLSRRKEFKDSLNLLVGYYQKNPTTANLPVFKNRILRNISDILKKQTETKEYIEALNFYGKYSTTWLKNSDRIDTAYFQALAFERAGVAQEAEKAYRIILEKLKSISGKSEEKKRKVYEHLPSIDSVNLRLAATAFEQKRYQDAFKFIKAINGRLSVPEDIEKIQIGAAVSELVGDEGRAILYLESLISTYGENKELLIKPRLNLARLYIKQKKPIEADKHLAAAEAFKKESNDFADENWLKTLELRAELQFFQGQKLAAVETLLKTLDAYEEKYPISSIRYRAGQILFDEGDITGAEKIWSQLSEKSGLVYKKLAVERLSHAEWTDTYKKYVDRIPAAEKLK